MFGMLGVFSEFERAMIQALWRVHHRLNAFGLFVPNFRDLRRPVQPLRVVPDDVVGAKIFVWIHALDVAVP
jgi:hypothetical protein